MDHPNIIKLYEAYEDNRYIYLLMEECSGGELFDRLISRITKKVLLTEREAAIIFKQLMSAIRYAHSQRICHRDIKPENILFLNTSDDSLLKLTGFKYSEVCPNEDHKMTAFNGTPYYIAPDVLAGKYNMKCDIWSAGVVLYLIITGEPPFNGSNDNEIFKKIREKSFSLTGPQWENISDDCKDLINHMLCDQDNRYSAEQVLNHIWVTNLAPNSKEVILSLNVDSLQNYKHINKFKKAVLTFIASRLREDEIQTLKDIFTAIDKNSDGKLTLEEIKEGMSSFGGKINVEEVFKSIDIMHTGAINYTDFIAATMDQKIYLKKEKLYEAFRAFDKDGSGKISLEEIKTVLQEKDEDMDKYKDLIKKYDINGDGEIDYNEFLMMMNTV
jgi:calcium-dependent protein kinase